MDWMNQLGGLLQQYAGARPGQTPASVDDDFDQFAQNAPPSAVSSRRRNWDGAARSAQSVSVCSGVVTGMP